MESTGRTTVPVLAGHSRGKTLARYWVDQCSPLSVVGVDPSEGFLEKAKEQLAGRVALQCGGAAEIPLCDASVDVTVSALVLTLEPAVFHGVGTPNSVRSLSSRRRLEGVPQSPIERH
jgi:hypothetical protein